MSDVRGLKIGLCGRSHAAHLRPDSSLKASPHRKVSQQVLIEQKLNLPSSNQHSKMSQIKQRQISVVFGASRTVVDLIRGESRHGLIVAIESKSIASVADSEDAREEAAVVHILCQRNIIRTGRCSGTRQPKEQQKASFLDRGTARRHARE